MSTKETSEDDGTPAHRRPVPLNNRRRRPAIILLAALLLAYQANLDFLPGDDATPNVYLPVAILERGTLSFSPEAYPFMFVWRLREPSGGAASPITVNGWLPESRRWPESIGYKLKQLQVVKEHYYLVSSPGEGRYLNTFGLGAGLFALPFFALAEVFVDLGSASDHLLWYVGKLASSCAVAGSAVLVFLMAARFCRIRNAFLIAVSYGLGTGVWSISSQALWQHGPNELFLALGCYFWFKKSLGNRDYFWCGLAWGIAVLCRPTSAMVVLVFGAWLALKERKALWPFILGGIPVLLLLIFYNWHYQGNLLAFGQTERGHSVALEKTGSPELWQTPLLEGMAGLLFSPSRGFFVFSPFLLLAPPGIWRIWRGGEYAALRPLTLAVAGQLIIASKWFDWWGGWTYGYRPIVDAMPLACLFLVPSIGWTLANRWRTAAFAILLEYSIAVQGIGAFCYDLTGWNNLRGMNIDKPENRARLWSWRDNEIIHYATHPGETREWRHQVAGIRGGTQ